MVHTARLVAGAAGVFLLAVWFLLSAVHQYRSGVLLRRLRRRDVLFLLPSWTYFRHPAVMDCVVLTRDRLDSGELTPWTRHRSYDVNLGLRPFWNPDRRVRYGVFDACMQVTRRGRLPSVTALADQPAYRALINFAGEQPREAGSVARQFMIVDSVGDSANGKPSTFFVSPFHDLR